MFVFFKIVGFFLSHQGFYFYHTFLDVDSQRPLVCFIYNLQNTVVVYEISTISTEQIMAVMYVDNNLYWLCFWLFCVHTFLFWCYTNNKLYMKWGTRLEKSQNAQKHLTGTFNQQTGILNSFLVFANIKTQQGKCLPLSSGLMGWGFLSVLGTSGLGAVKPNMIIQKSLLSNSLWQD